MKARKAYHKQVHSKLRSLRSSNPKDYWAILNSNDKKVASKISTQILFEHFKKLNQNPAKTSGEASLDSPDPSTIEDMTPFNLPFTDDEISKFVTKLRNGKSSGLDSIINEFLKHSQPAMKSLISKYFNLNQDSGLIPSDWSQGIIILIFKKKGDGQS